MCDPISDLKSCLLYMGEQGYQPKTVIVTRFMWYKIKRATGLRTVAEVKNKYRELYGEEIKIKIIWK